MAKFNDKDKDAGVQRLKEALRQGTPERIYVFFGDETFLLEHYLLQLKKTVLDELTESFNYHRLTPETFQLRDFADAVENLPMMAERTLVQVDDIDLFKLPEDSRNKLAEILSDIPDYCTVVFTYFTTPWKPDKRYKKLWDAVGQNAVDFSKRDRSELVNWVYRHFLAGKKQITPELCGYLVDLTDGTMTSLSSEIRKIVAYSGADTICKADIDAVTEPVLDAVVFRMTDQMAAGDYGKALVTLQKLMKMQQEPLAILGAVGQHFRRIGTARLLMDNGKGYGELMKLAGITEYPAKKAMDAARRFGPRFCARASALIVQADYQMKTSFDDPQRILELLVLQLAQEKAHD